MKTKLLITILGLMPAMAFAQNYQTQYLFGTRLDDPTSYHDVTSGTWQYGAEERLQQAQTQINWLKENQGQVASTQDKMTPNSPSQNFNEPTPRTGK